MGLFLRVNLFYQVDHDDVLNALAEFYQQSGQAPIDHGEESCRYELYESNNDWTVLCWDGGWEWEIRRQAQLVCF